MKQLLEEAMQIAGLTDFGDERFKLGLAALLDTYSSNNFTTEAQGKLRRRMLELLVSRLQIEDAFKRHPEALEQTISQPLFLTGLPRTGTSALLNVLSVDPAWRSLKLWEAHNPSPLEGLAPGQEDPRYLRVKKYYDAMNESSDFKKIHFMGADSAEECIFLTNHTFEDAAYGFEIFLEPYAEFYRGVERGYQYAYHANLLRLLQWQRPGESWLLKTPSHVCHLDIILSEHPDAGIVITHRNPLEVVGSYCSMMMTVVPEQSRTDPHDMGRRVLEHLAMQMDQSMDSRARLDSSRIVDVNYNDFIEDSVAVVEDIYESLAIRCPAETRDSISQYVVDHPRGKHGSHDYQLADFGLTENQVQDRFARYLASYDLAV
ncbi:sulfotransferase [Halieaceae bacterium IMCC14734]|uniref:Sulfotransferase n=1 Tax=Candidatus Litorirhabdus singularis TaxID=2518993 RepID=A0ABT3TAI1_9GAMM|nr:sulfotransferase [Candidatus Litorirhabdus singularis]MCX2979303.1 sulfotransferase [Candidatus Litorirhabdus singularis]